MTAPDKIWAYTYDIEREDGSWAYSLPTWQVTNLLPIMAVEYTRTASIPAPGAKYKNLFNNCHIDLRGAGYFCAFRNDGQILGVYGDGDKILCDYGSMNFDGLHILSDAALAARDAALSARITAPGADYVASVQYAINLAQTLRDQHYSTNADWKPLPDLLGLMTQIDNMIAGIAARPIDTMGALCEGEGCPHCGTAHIRINNRPTDTRVVTVAQLERLINQIEVATYWNYASDEKRHGPDPIAEEIRAIIGGQANAE